MFDEEIANDRKNMKLLDDIAKLAAECLKMEENVRPPMVEVADRLRTVRKAFHQRKGRTSTGTNSGLNKSGKAEYVISPSPAMNNNDKTLPSVEPTISQLPPNTDINSGLIKIGKAVGVISPTPLTLATVNNNDKTPPSVVPIISMDEFKEITKNFSNDALIGKGSSSKVFLGVLKDGHISAIKKFDHTNKIVSEVPAGARFKHMNVIRLLGYCVQGYNHVLAYEYAAKGSLHDILHGRKNVIRAEPGLVLSWAQRVKIALSAATGLEFLHEKAQPCVIHSCIKSRNIFLFDSDVAKIGGLGASRVEEDDEEYPGYLYATRPLCFTGRSSRYTIPGRLSKKSDVYSFGIVLELLTGRKLFDHTLPSDQQSLVMWAAPRLSEHKVQQCVDKRLGGDYPPNAAAKLHGDR
uniref:Uncharacterized protein n=1 Tax=Avena sativa TaxID=4498 RepID=A0ACD5XBP1_AVESA